MAMAAISFLSNCLSSLLPPKSLPPSLLSLSSQQLKLPKITHPEWKWTSLVATVNVEPAPSFLFSITTGDTDFLGFVCPSLAYAKTLYFKSGFNVQIDVEDNEPEDRILLRFRKAVMKAGIMKECKRRRFFENSQDKKKRKTRDAARRNRKRRPPKRVQDKKETPKEEDLDEDDNWVLPEGDLPYC